MNAFECLGAAILAVIVSVGIFWLIIPKGGSDK